MVIIEYFFRNRMINLFLFLLLQEVQKELQEQRDLIEVIAHHSSSSDLEQEAETQSQKHPRYDTNPFRFQASSCLVLKICHMVD